MKTQTWFGQGAAQHSSAARSSNRPDTHTRHPAGFEIIFPVCSPVRATPRARKWPERNPIAGAHHVNKPANDNGGPVQAADFPDTPEGLAARRAWLATAPATHASHHAQSPCATWAKREKDETTFVGLRLWRDLNAPPRTAANDNEVDEEDTEGGEQPILPNLDREMIDVSAKQLIWAHENKRTRWVENKLVKVWDGHAWVGPEDRFGEVRQRKSDKADTEHFDAEMPDAQAELARTMDTEKLRNRLGAKACTVLDMAAGDSTLAEIGDYLGFAGQYGTRNAGKEVRAAVGALNAALAEGERAAA
jgi:hypothetical protein